MGQRGEDNLGLAQRRVLGSDVSDLAGAKPHPLATLLVGGCECERKAGVLGDQATQLPTSVTARAEDTHRNFMHRECITLHSCPVNDPLPVSRALIAAVLNSPRGQQA